MFIRQAVLATVFTGMTLGAVAAADAAPVHPDGPGATYQTDAGLARAQALKAQAAKTSEPASLASLDKKILPQGLSAWHVQWCDPIRFDCKDAGPGLMQRTAQGIQIGSHIMNVKMTAIPGGFSGVIPDHTMHFYTVETTPDASYPVGSVRIFPTYETNPDIANHVLVMSPPTAADIRALQQH